MLWLLFWWFYFYFILFLSPQWRIFIDQQPNNEQEVFSSFNVYHILFIPTKFPVWFWFNSRAATVINMWLIEYLIKRNQHWINSGKETELNIDVLTKLSPRYNTVERKYPVSWTQKYVGSPNSCSLCTFITIFYTFGISMFNSFSLRPIKLETMMLTKIIILWKSS